MIEQQHDMIQEQNEQVDRFSPEKMQANSADLSKELSHTQIEVKLNSQRKNVFSDN